MALSKSSSRAPRLFQRWPYALGVVAMLSPTSFAQAQPSAETQAAAAATPEPGPDRQTGSSASAASRAELLYHHGETLYAEGDYDSALAAFEQAYAQSGRAALLFNMANALERSGRYQEAIDRLRQYQPHAEAAEQLTLLKRIHHLNLRVSELQKESHDAKQACAPTPSTADGSGMTKGPDTEQSEPKPKQTPTSVWGYGLVGLGVAALGASAFLGLQASAAGRQAGRLCDDGLCPEEADQWLEDERKSALAADVSLAAGLTAVGAGLFFLLRPEQETQVGVGAGPTGASVNVQGRF